MSRGGTRPGAGRPQGSVKPAEERTRYKTFSISCRPSEYERIKYLSQESGKTISRFLVDLALSY